MKGSKRKASVMEHLLYVELCFHAGVPFAEADDALDELNDRVVHQNRWTLVSTTSPITGAPYPHKMAYLWDTGAEGKTLDPMDPHHGKAFQAVVEKCEAVVVHALTPHEYSPKAAPQPYPPPPAKSNSVNHYFLVAKLTARTGKRDALVAASTELMKVLAEMPPGKVRWKLLASGTYGERSVLNFWRLDDASALLDGLRAFEEEPKYAAVLATSARHEQDIHTSIRDNPLGSNPD